MKVGTIMEDSPIGLDKWFAAMWLLGNAKNGISSYEIGRALGVTRPFREDQIDALLGKDALSGLPRIGRKDVEIRGEKGSQRGEDVRFIIHHEERAFVHGAHQRGPQRFPPPRGEVVKVSLRPLIHLIAHSGAESK